MEAIENPPDLEQLFRDTAGDLARYFSRRHAAGEASSDDLVQETFMEMAKGLKKGLQPDSPRGYLFGIARRVSQAAWRRRDREREFSSEMPVEAVAETPGPDDRVAAACEIIASLPPLQREVLDLRFTHGLAYADIAEALNIPLGTVRSRIHNAVAAVREGLAADDPDILTE